jgi:undecaprenyl-diphosphatase
MKSPRTAWFLLILLWAVAFVAALLADRATADWVRHAPLYHRTDWFVPLVKLPGNFLFVIAIALVLAIFHRRRWRAALPLLLAGPLVGLGYLLLKWTVGRRRPVIVAAPFDFHPFARGLGGLIHAESGLSFPSGHAAMAFATATCLSAALPRWAPAFFLVAFAVAAERVLENAHYLSDVVAGAGVGILGGYIAIRLVRRWFGPENKAPAEPRRLSDRCV